MNQRVGPKPLAFPEKLFINVRYYFRRGSAFRESTNTPPHCKTEPSSHLVGFERFGTFYSLASCIEVFPTRVKKPSSSRSVAKSYSQPMPAFSVPPSHFGTSSPIPFYHDRVHLAIAPSQGLFLQPSERVESWYRDWQRIARCSCGAALPDMTGTSLRKPNRLQVSGQRMGSTPWTGCINSGHRAGQSFGPSSPRNYSQMMQFRMGAGG
jgi:hypothetical protein